MIRHESLSIKQCDWMDLSVLRGATVFVTGGTGLVGYNLLVSLCAVRDILDIRLIALVRDIARARNRFAGFEGIEFVEGDVVDLPEVDGPIDYVIHAASVTSSKFFVEKPVETIATSVDGTKSILELCRRKSVKSMVYLSSMEVYGTPREDVLLTEADLGYLDPLQVRSCYPEGKRMCENLCAAYASEYGVDVKIARLAQTFGPGMQKNDNRAVIQFLQSVLKGENISIKASGESARMYLYTFDAVTALLTIMLLGTKGKAYNVANKETFCSVKCLAETMCTLFNPAAQVFVNTGSEQELAMYPPDSFLRLDTTALEDLGWRAFLNLADSLENLADHLCQD